MDFLVTRGSRPRPEDLCYRIATIHRDSVSPIPNKFGFPTYTYHNNIPQLADWDSDWARFFAKMLKHACELETATHGPWLSRHPGFATLFEQTIPRLLGALQSEGRFIKPSLVHGNLSPRNMRENVATASPILFGFASLYAHNEYELGAWCCRELGWPYFKEYRRHFPPSEPTEQWNDRIRLYSIKFNLNQVLTVSDSAELRNQILRDINELNQLYGS
ncbi:hypothetical protein LZ32DRAFT_614231 [Colletotrichum eremochloae]|nr:hypothetical protein LZ32DRAFT_614231 [Colletotrichum eremochloae]